MQSLIVVIDDEEDILELIEYNLQKENYEVIGFLSTQNVERLLEEENVDLMIVDRNLPGVEGSDFIKRLRTKGIQTPVIFLSAKGAEDEVLEGFMKGGDDYMTKPFAMGELIARVKAMLKRTKPENQEVFHYRDIILNTATRQVFVEDEEIELTKLEFKLMLTMIKNKNIVLSRDFLLENVWPGDASYQEKTVNVAIKRLKEKIDPYKDKSYIKSVRGEGYTLC